MNSEAALKALRHEYSKGITAGIKMTLDQLEQKGPLVQSGCYQGPMPDELLTWIGQTRDNLALAEEEE